MSEPGLPIPINPKSKRLYIPTKHKFILANLTAIMWFTLSCFISYPWVLSLAQLVGSWAGWFIVLFIALIPGYLNMFLLVSLLIDRPPPLQTARDLPPVSILIAAYNEEKSILETLRSLRQQNYPGIINIIVIDDGSLDRTKELVLNCGMPNVKLIEANHQGKSAALNKGLQYVADDYVITIDADTFLHPQAITRIMARMLGDPGHTAAVAGCVLAKNSRDTFMTRLQEWDYFLAISSVKRQQALYQGTLVAQGAFSVYKTAVVKEVSGWPSCIGEDIVLTWALIKKGYRIGYEATAVGFTEVPTTFMAFARQRRRWARGMIEGFKAHIDLIYKRFSPTAILVGIDLLYPLLDLTYTFVYIPGIILALFGYYWIVGPMTLAVIPLTLYINYTMYKYQRSVFQELNLKIRQNKLGFVVYTVCYQILMSPVCVWGYFEEFFGIAKRW
ncbi:glycosyltransferase [Desulforamulus hydrothermalis]|uniref:Glycosyl transferase family 2 n=1 Tax=Desulforamulus hydrothermalis Lam5 = DSM 18033 TaxID=1121428 RepID=K8E948_9FIRM|nr:glycosyltransferase family 2 protein [Desulforamulus hydrothermalis]CCO08058.1 Glycosyl transferase family 2 [Desulforamulus hydrothermalis Lam5 = DSM 18033]SHG83054.1 biofilm PGA synthesis N-glycosyltransferase PgaC [Desulforamulus hydrothermalis Lam5 = DSM 18033]